MSRKLINKKIKFTCVKFHFSIMSQKKAQSVMCLTTDARLTADPGVTNSIPAGPILSWRVVMKLFLWSFSSLPLIYSRKVVVSYKRKYVREVLVNCLFKLAQEKSVVM